MRSYIRLSPNHSPPSIVLNLIVLQFSVSSIGSSVSSGFGLSGISTGSSNSANNIFIILSISSLFISKVDRYCLIANISASVSSLSPKPNIILLLSSLQLLKVHLQLFLSENDNSSLDTLASNSNAGLYAWSTTLTVSPKFISIYSSYVKAVVTS